MPQLRIATYNIHKCRGLDGRTSPRRIAEVLHAVRADVIALQEVVSVESGPPELNQAEFLARELGMDCAFGENRKLFGGRYGNVVLSRHSMRSHCNYDLSVPGREQRGCLRTDIALEGADMHVFNVHLGTGFIERRHQGRLLLAEELIRSRELSGPRVVLGDFNEWAPGLASQLLRAEFQSADIRMHLRSRRTYPGVFPLMHLDHIYYDGSMVLNAVGLHRTRLSLIASDHLPIWADFDLP
jgi:endonuclease/exonuclease/phosphatase family metal-dependent hydrolase